MDISFFASERTCGAVTAGDDSGWTMCVYSMSCGTELEKMVVEGTIYCDVRDVCYLF